jgi:predicted nucleic acid-binding protein
MILVDTSVWVRHLRKGAPELTERLNEGLVLTHPFVVGELACGSLRHRSRFLNDLKQLPAAATATDDEALLLIEERQLWGLGIGWIDAHLLASALLSSCRLWTLDRRLAGAAAAARVRLY